MWWVGEVGELRVYERFRTDACRFVPWDDVGLLPASAIVTDLRSLCDLFPNMLLTIAGAFMATPTMDVYRKRMTLSVSLQRSQHECFATLSAQKL